MITKAKLILVTTALFIGSFAIAQEGQKPKVEKEEEIIIKKSGDKVEKMTIVVDGDNVTINGKPVDEYENNNVIIMKKRGNMGGHGSMSGMGGRSPMIRKFHRNMDDSDMLTDDIRGSNKAMLGVMSDKSADGAKITEVTKESGAEKAGLKKDDVITKVGATKITGPEDLAEAIRSYKPKDKVDITYKRNNKESKTSATLGESKVRSFAFNFNNDDFNFEMPEMPEMPEIGEMPGMDRLEMMMNKRPKIGLQIQDVEDGKGVNVKDVDENSPASKAGLIVGDVITQVNGKDLEGVDELRKAMKELKEGETIKLGYKRNGTLQSADVKIPKKLKTADL